MSDTGGRRRPKKQARLEETFEYRCYLCLASMMGTLRSDHLGSDGDHDDSDYAEGHITELLGDDIDEVFESQHVDGVFGTKRWAFTNPATNFQGDDLEARLFRDLDADRYYLVFPPTRQNADKINNVLTALGVGIPDEYRQAAQLIELVRPEFRERLMISGFSLGGGLAAYAALKASWMVRAIVFDPLGLNRKMLGESGLGVFGQGEVLSDRFRSMDEYVDWYYIANSSVARTNIERHLSSIGRVTELPQDPVRANNNPDTHDFRHVRYGLHQLWKSRTRKTPDPASSDSRPSSRPAERSSPPKGAHTITLELASCNWFPPSSYIMRVVKGTVLESLTTPEGHYEPFFGTCIWAYPDISDEIWVHKVQPVIDPRISRLVDQLKVMEGYSR